MSTETLTEEKIMSMDKDQIREHALDLLELPMYHTLRKSEQLGFFRQLWVKWIYVKGFSFRDGEIVIKLREKVEEHISGQGDPKLKRYCIKVFGKNWHFVMRYYTPSPVKWMVLALLICCVKEKN